VAYARLALLRTKVATLYPDLRALQGSVRRGDWAAVSACFEQLPARSNGSVAVSAVAQIRGSERFLQRIVDTERDSSLARTLLGARLIVIGWNARGGARARYVKPAQWRVFHDYLQRAERVLADATAIDATNAAAWSERITVARGLGLGQHEARRRYDRAAEHCDVPYTAQARLLQTLCPKWGGSFGDVFAFARQCLTEATPGSLGGAIIADAHVEHGLEDYRHFDAPGAREELVAAASQTVLHPDFRPVHGWVGAHSAFAFALFHGGSYLSAAQHFTAMGNRASGYPWYSSDVFWRSAFLRARHQVGHG
jgi:hypothetical protein